jgi:uncharacterized protein
MSDTRDCIKCNKPLTPKMVDDVEVDYCDACGGMWLDSGEIRQLAEKSESALEELRELVQKGAPTDAAPSTVDSPCPACGGKLTVACLGIVNLERCSACHGIFLDRGELDKALTVVKSKGDEVATILALARCVVTRGCIGD